MNREDALDAMAYWHNLNPKVLGKVTAAEYTSDKDHSSACIYVNLNPEGSKWIDFVKKKIDMDERQQRLAFNSCYGMYVEERPKFDLKNYLYFKNGEEMKMTTSAKQIEIEYDEKKRQLLREQEERTWQAKQDYEKTLEAIDHEYAEALLTMEKEQEAAKNKEKAYINYTPNDIRHLSDIIRIFGDLGVSYAEQHYAFDEVPTLKIEAHMDVQRPDAFTTNHTVQTNINNKDATRTPVEKLTDDLQDGKITGEEFIKKLEEMSNDKTSKEPELK